jgi:23S rRNA-/tRNA-specific pseudouridylate synthase
MSSRTNRRANSTSSNADASPSAVIDNPCWGSPTQHSLAHLLSLYPKEQCVLLESPEYLVLNKPPDVRMDGNAQFATVQKMLMTWYPPASLQAIKPKHLLQTVSTLQNMPIDLELRHCHQLDYATSGVVLYARSKEAAAAAQQAFFQRKVDKKYLAVLHGTLQVNTQHWPVVPEERLQVLQELETLYRQDRAQKRSDTFDGFMPPHSVLQKWSTLYLKRMQQKDNQATKRLKPSDNAVDLDELMKQAMGEHVLTSTELTELANSSWKQIKRHHPEWKGLLERLADLYNAIMREEAQTKQDEERAAIDLPTLFRVQGEQDNAFYIFAPIAEAENDFAMRVKSGTLPKDQTAFEGTLDLDYKPSLTRCVILETKSQGGKAVTKAQLHPKTGRRHQLRIHMLVAGTSILGDATYEPEESKGTYPRMCLHAQSLSLPVLGGKQLTVEASDPFDLDEIIKGIAGS